MENNQKFEKGTNTGGKNGNNNRVVEKEIPTWKLGLIVIGGFALVFILIALLS